MSGQNFLRGYTYTMHKLAEFSDADGAERVAQAMVRDPEKLHHVMMNGTGEEIFSHLGYSGDTIKSLMANPDVEGVVNEMKGTWARNFGHMSGREFGREFRSTLGAMGDRGARDAFAEMVRRAGRGGGGGVGLKTGLIVGGLGAATGAGIGLYNYMASKRRKDELAKRQAARRAF